MIFVTIGTQEPFDRLIRAVDDIAPLLGEPVKAQVLAGSYQPKHLELVPRVTPAEFEALVDEARVIVAHAGIGTIVTGLIHRKPVIVVPRKASLGEHRNEHQLATADKLASQGYAYVCYETSDILPLLQRQDLKPMREIGMQASPELVGFVSDFIDNLP